MTGRRLAVLGGGVAAVLMACAAPAAFAQDGRAVFDARCASCHALAAGTQPMPGPALSGLAGRRVGGDPAFDYSPALREAEGGWDAQRLDRFLADPEEMFPGLWMGGNGIAQAAQRRAVVEFLMGR